MSASQVWIYPAIITGMWLAWLVFWRVSAQGGKPTARVESAGSRFMHLLPLFAGICLLGMSPVTHLPVLSEHALPWSRRTYWFGVALQAAGLAFTVWARVHLGRNWSGMVTLKEGHELVRSGPYRWVRHPI